MKPFPAHACEVPRLLDGSQTVVFRVIEPQPPAANGAGMIPDWWLERHLCPWCVKPLEVDGHSGDCPECEAGWMVPESPNLPYAPGDRLQVLEEFGIEDCLHDGERSIYKADRQSQWLGDGAGDKPFFLPSDYDSENIKWFAASDMPIWASRLTLTVLTASVVRIGEVGEVDAIKAGFRGVTCDCAIGGPLGCTDCMNTGWVEPPQVDLIYEWDANNPGHPFESNPWAARYEVEKV